MEFDKAVLLIYEKVPEFKESYNGDPNEDGFGLFLGTFSMFVRDSLEKNETHSFTALKLINDLVNENSNDGDFMDRMVVDVLEIFTDKKSSQKAAFEIFTGDCLRLFKELFDCGMFRIS